MSDWKPFRSELFKVDVPVSRLEISDIRVLCEMTLTEKMWMFAVHSHPDEGAAIGTREPSGIAEREPHCAAISQIFSKEDANFSTSQRVTPATATTGAAERRWAVLQWDKEGQREAAENGGGREKLHCLCCPQPPASRGHCCCCCCSAAEDDRGKFGICRNPCELETSDNKKTDSQRVKWKLWTPGTAKVCFSFSFCQQDRQSDSSTWDQRKVLKSASAHSPQSFGFLKPLAIGLHRQKPQQRS